MKLKKETNLIIVVPVLIIATLAMVFTSGKAIAEGYSYPGGGISADQWEDAEYQVLIKNVNIFDGKTDKLIEGMDVVIIGEHSECDFEIVACPVKGSSE